jgi:hypothetical protein
MTRTGKVVLALVVVTVLFWAGVAAAVAWTVHAVATSPAIEISVREGGGSHGHVSLRLPAALVGVGVALAGDDVRDRLHAEIGSEIDLAAWGPAAAEIAHQLETLPDATLVEVRDGGDHVRIAKRGDDLRIRVRSANGDDVDVTVPASVASDLLGHLAAN